MIQYMLNRSILGNTARSDYVVNHVLIVVCDVGDMFVHGAGSGDRTGAAPMKIRTTHRRPPKLFQPSSLKLQSLLVPGYGGKTPFLIPPRHN